MCGLAWGEGDSGHLFRDGLSEPHNVVDGDPSRKQMECQHGVFLKDRTEYFRGMPEIGLASTGSLPRMNALILESDVLFP